MQVKLFITDSDKLWSSQEGMEYSTHSLCYGWCCSSPSLCTRDTEKENIGFLSGEPGGTSDDNRYRSWVGVLWANVGECYGGFLYGAALRQSVSQSVPTLCDPMDCSLPGSSDHGDSSGKKTGVESKSGKKTYMCISLKKTYRWLANTWKDAQHHLLLEKYKSKLQWDTTSHQSEWPWSKVYKPQPLERAWRKGSPLALLVGLQTDAATMEDGMEIP